jgi:hypothetical protein
MLMSQPMAVLTAVAVLVSAGMWMSLRVAAGSDLGVLPASCRRRLSWWRVNARGVYLICAVVFAVTVAWQLPYLSS